MAIIRAVEATTESALLWLERIASFGLFCVVLLELVNVTLRIFGMGIPQAGDIGALTVFLICFLGMGRGFLKGSHVRFTWVVEQLPARLAKAVGAAGWLLSLGALYILIWYGLSVTIRFFSMYLPTVSMPWFPTWLPMAAMPLGSALSFAAILVYLHRRSTAVVEPPERSMDV